MVRSTTYKDAAIAVLEEAEEPMHRKDILDLAQKKHGLNHRPKNALEVMTSILNKNLGTFRRDSTAHFSLVDKSSTIAEKLGDTPESSDEFNKISEKIKQIGNNTTENRTVAKRIGQEHFRQGLLIHWDKKCYLTGVINPNLLVASHIVPWSRCAEIRLDLFNGIILSPFWDRAFDKGLVTFDLDGEPIISKEDLTKEEINCLSWQEKIPLKEEHKKYMQWHSFNIYKNKNPNAIFERE